MCVYACIHIYIYNMNVYIYIYVCAYICVHAYITCMRSYLIPQYQHVTSPSLYPPPPTSSFAPLSRIHTSFNKNPSLSLSPSLLAHSWCLSVSFLVRALPLAFTCVNDCVCVCVCVCTRIYPRLHVRMFLAFSSSFARISRPICGGPW